MLVIYHSLVMFESITLFTLKFRNSPCWYWSCTTKGRSQKSREYRGPSDLPPSSGWSSLPHLFLPSALMLHLSISRPHPHPSLLSPSMESTEVLSLYAPLLSPPPSYLHPHPHDPHVIPFSLHPHYCSHPAYVHLSPTSRSHLPLYYVLVSFLLL